MPAAQFSAVSAVPVPFSPPGLLDSIVVSRAFVSLPFGIFKAPYSGIVMASISLSKTFSNMAPGADVLSWFKT